jgi:hypothetical protein
MHTDAQTRHSIDFQTQEDEAKLLIKLSCDSKRASIVIDITSAVKENIIVSTKNAEDEIVNVFSWYLSSGRNISSVKNLLPGDYTIQILSIEGELVGTYSMLFPDKIMV